MHGCAQIEPRVIWDMYGVKRFVTQQLQEQAGKHAGMMAAFCERMGWRNLEMLIAAFQARPNLGCNARSPLLLTVQLSACDSIPLYPCLQARNAWRSCRLQGLCIQANSWQRAHRVIAL